MLRMILQSTIALTYCIMLSASFEKKENSFMSNVYPTSVIGATNSTKACADHTDCGSCTEESTCHWCGENNGCHAYLSVYGCGIAVSCDETCVRTEPQHIGTLDADFTSILAVLIISGSMLLCCGLCIGACEAMVEPEAKSIELEHTGFFEPFDTANFRGRRNISDSTENVLDISEIDGNQTNNPLDDPLLRRSQYVGMDELVTSEINEEENSKTFISFICDYLPGCTICNKLASCCTNFLNQTVGKCCHFFRPYTHRIYSGCRCCQKIFLIALVIFFIPAIVYFPRMPQYTICNRAIDWTSIYKNIFSQSIYTGLAKMSIEGDVDVLLSISNRNHFDLTIEMFNAEFTYKGEPIGKKRPIEPYVYFHHEFHFFFQKHFISHVYFLWHIFSPTWSIPSGTIVDLWLPVSLTPGFYTAQKMLSDYQSNKLILTADVSLRAKVSSPWFSQSIGYHLKPFEIDVGQEFDQRMCKCP